MYENLKPGDVIATEKYIVKVDDLTINYTMALEKSGAFSYGNGTCVGVVNDYPGSMPIGIDTRYCTGIATPELFHDWSLKWLKDYCRPDAVIERAHKFTDGDLVTIRDEHEIAKVIRSIDDDGEVWCEVEAANLPNVPHREVREIDLHPYHQ